MKFSAKKRDLPVFLYNFKICNLKKKESIYTVVKVSDGRILIYFPTKANGLNVVY